MPSSDGALPVSVARQTIAAALSVQNRQRVAAEAAARIIADASVRNHRQPSAVLVDGRAGAPLSSVRLDGGRIEVRYALIADVLAWINQQLVTHSPVRSGAYAGAHTWFADGQPFDLAHPPEAKVYTVLNPLPYARKIEQGGMKMTAPGTSGVYEVVAALAQRRFNNLVTVEFAYRSPILDYVPGGANRAERAALRRQPARLSVMRLERATRVPALNIALR